MTTSEQKSGKIFYGWWVVLVAGVGLSLSYGPIIVATFGVFLKPLSQEFGWSRTGISLAFSLANLVLSGALPLIGRLVDRLGARKVILPSVLIFGLGVMSFYFLSASLWHFYALYLLLGVVSSGTTPAYSKVISRWFDQKRGLALGLAMAGIGVGGIHHAPSGASPHYHSGLAPSLRVPGSPGHRDYHSSGRVVSEGDTAADGIVA